MDLYLLIAAGVIIALLLFVILRMGRTQSDPEVALMQQQIGSLRQEVGATLSSQTSRLDQQLGQITTQVNQQLGQVVQQLQSATGQIGSRLDNAAKVVGEVKQSLGELSKATQQVFDVGKDIASLQEILRSPKLRGGFGEMLLGDLLGQILPATHFTLQHKFKSGEAVDAVIRLGPGLVPIDAKFPLENFRRLAEAATDDDRKNAKKKFAGDVKRHIDAISQKYIVPSEDTFDFAMMYVPAENVYYETIIKDDDFGEEKSISGYALSKRVIPVSPNTFFAYLQAIVLGLRGMQVEKNAKMILGHLQTLRIEFDRFADEFSTVGKHLTNARSKYDDAEKRMGRVGDRLKQIGGEEEPPRLQSP